MVLCIYCISFYLYCRFNNPNPQVSTREPTNGAQPPKLNGFTKGTQIHRFGPTLDTARDLRKMSPYVAKSIIKRDPYFADFTHSAKLHTAVKHSFHQWLVLLMICINFTKTFNMLDLYFSTISIADNVHHIKLLLSFLFSHNCYCNYYYYGVWTVVRAPPF